RVEFFDAEASEAAVARLDGLLGYWGQRPAAARDADDREPAAPEPPFANAAWRAVQRSQRAWNERDWDAVLACRAPGMVQDDRRALVGVVLSGDELLANMRVLFGARSLQLDQRLLATRGERLSLQRVSMQGVVGGGGPVAYEFLSMVEVDREGLIARLTMFESEQLDAAQAELDARFESLSGDGARPHVDTAATCAAERFAETFRARDVAGLATLLAPDFVNTDRRSITATELDRAAFLASFGPILDLVKHTQADHQVLATRGQRLALARFCLQLTGFDGSDAGPSEIEFLQVLEVDSDGRIAAGVGLEAADRAAGWAQLDARYHAGEAAPFASVAAGMRAFHAAFAARDWDALAAQCAPDIAVNDHRRLGWESLHGPEAYVAALRALVELAPDTRLRLDHVELDATRYLVITVWEGTREGGPFEEPSWMVAELDREGRVRRFDQYDLQREDAARARYGEVARSARDPLARWLRPNAASRARDAVAAAMASRDWQAMRAAYSADGRLEDRRRMLGHSMDADTAVRTMAWMYTATPDLHIERELLAVFGDRLSLERQTWRGASGGGAFEVEMLALHEADPEGRLAAVIDFDPDDSLGAHREAHERWAALEPAHAARMRVSAGYFDALRARDAARLRALLADDVVVHDRRRTGGGLLVGADAYVESVRAQWRLTRETAIEVVARPLGAPFGSLTLVRVAGVLADGEPYETLVLLIVVIVDGLFRRMELFEPDDAELALARFEELGREYAARPAGGPTPDSGS
ncbi:MAG TPA: nuclear transport factor 2 family protein, partial [Myxococcota bacterium]|nr:nuclear transport factor 2 family protein [Myxococcota bacterium]